MPQENSDVPPPSLEAGVLLLACVLPTVVTLAYFVWAAESASSVQQTVYAVAKVVQFALPVVWVGWFCRQRLGWPRFSGRGLWLGLAFGLVVSAAMWLLYRALLGTPMLDQALKPIQEKIAGLGLNSTWRFAALGVFYSLVHSLLEEYYWRWFVFRRMQRLMPLILAVVLSSVAFAAHHVVVLWTYFSHAPVVALLLAACVGVGGAFWAWLYHRSQSIYAVWLSHLCIDAAIFVVGYDLARPLFPGGV